MTDIDSRLLAYGFSREAIKAPEGMPEQLILSQLADEPMTSHGLSMLPWYAKDWDRCHLAFKRLELTRRIVPQGLAWQVPGRVYFQGNTEPKRSEERPARQKATYVQRSLF